MYVLCDIYDFIFTTNNNCIDFSLSVSLKSLSNFFDFINFNYFLYLTTEMSECLEKELNFLLFHCFSDQMTFD